MATRTPLVRTPPLGIAQVQSAVGATPNPTEATGAFVDLDEMTITFTPRFEGSRIIIIFDGMFRNNTASCGAEVVVNIDGSDVATTTRGGVSAAANLEFTLTSHHETTLSIASHTIKIRWRRTIGGTAIAFSTYRRLTLIEIVSV